MKNLILVILLAGLSCSKVNEFPAANEFYISDKAFRGHVSFSQLSSVSGFRIQLNDHNGRMIDHKIFRYKPYRFDTADVDQDGSTDIIVGLIKPTHFDPIESKRLFILQIKDNHIIPMWLGSKVCQELVDFKTSSNGHIVTLEQTTKGNFAIGDYFWQSFGLALDNYQYNEISLSDAKQIFNN